MRLNALLPLTLGCLAGASCLTSLAALAFIAQQRGPVEAHLPRIGAAVAVSLAVAALAFALAWLVLRAYLVRPIDALTREAETLALTRASRALALPERHALDELPRAVGALAGRLGAARSETEAAIAEATRRAEEQKSWLETILIDLTEGIIVCNLEHRILLYNEAAARILSLREALGLGRPLFGLLASEPILQTIELLRHGAGGGQATHRFVCATADHATLLETQLSLIGAPSGAVTGYVLSFADIGREAEDLALRDAILRETMVEWRRPLANLRAAAETLFSAGEVAPGERAAFEEIISKEIENLNARFLETSRRYEHLTAGPWPLSEIHSLDLFQAVEKHLLERDGIALTPVGVPLWLRADSHSLILALEHLIRALARTTGRKAMDIEAVRGEAYAYVEVTWEGAPIPAALLDSWLDEPLKGAVAARTTRQIVENLGGELWSRPKHGGRACLRLPLRRLERPKTAPAGGPGAPRPEYYDFDLFTISDAIIAETPLRQLPYVVFDTETTGLRPTEGDELISIGAVRIVNGRILTGETFERLIHPGRPIPPASTRFHGITDEMVEGKPPARIVLPQFKNFVGDSVLVAYNVAFDMRFLELKQEEAGVRFNNPVLDALLLSLHVSEAPDPSLSATAERFGVEVAGRHTALGDAMMTAAIWVKLIDLLEARGIRTFGEAIRLSSRLVEQRRQVAQF